jgi:orotate phosphoribosyltransferase
LDSWFDKHLAHKIFESDLRKSRVVDVMGSKRSRLLELLKQTSYRESETASFHLASGMLSKYYVDCKYVLSYPEARKILASLICELIKNETIDSVGGLELGAYPIATSVSDKLYTDTGRVVRAFVVRKDRKKHGIETLIAGDGRQGDHVLVVDDVITSGSSAIQAIETVRQAGMTVNHVVALVDREESDGKKNIEARGVKFDALFTLTDLINFDGHSDESADTDSGKKRLVRGQSSRSATAS